MSIAKVEPLTTARSLRGPFDYRLPRAPGRGRGRHACSWSRSARRRLLGVVVDVAERSELPPERLAEPLAALEAGVPAGAGRARALGGARVLLDPGARARAGAPARGPERAPRGPRRAPDRDRSPSAAEARAATASSARRSGRASGRRSSCWSAPGPARRRRSSPRPGSAATRCAGSSAAASSSSASARCAGARAPRRSARRRRRCALDPAQRRGARRGSSPGSTSGGAPLLLHGVTGRGKTEVYLRRRRGGARARPRRRSCSCRRSRSRRRPLARFVARFGDSVAVLHSRLAAARALRRVAAAARAARRAICVGPRSAVFAPFARPRPDRRRRGARRLLQAGGRSALRRARGARAARRAGGRRAACSASATPRARELARARAPRAARARRRPRRCRRSSWSTCAALRPRGPLHAAHPSARSTSFAPRRRRRSCCSTGAAGPTSCPAASAAARGSARTATSRSSLHRAGEACAATTAATASGCRATCPDCGSVPLARHGAGTEQLEDELAALRRPLPVFRLDSDARRAGAAPRGPARASSAARVGRAGRHADGRQGPRLPGRRRSAVVLDADSTLRFPDFRAEERTFALRRPARRPQRPRRARRPGDRADAGSPRPRLIAAPPRHDSEGFLAGELERRAGARLPAVRPPDPGRALAPEADGARPGGRRPARCARRRAARGRGRPRAGAAVSPARPRAPPDRDQGARPRARGGGDPRGRPRAGARRAAARDQALRRRRFAVALARAPREPPKYTRLHVQQRLTRNRC